MIVKVLTQKQSHQGLKAEIEAAVMIRYLREQVIETKIFVYLIVCEIY